MATLLGGTQQQEKDKDNQQQQSGAVITPIGLTGSGGGGAAPGASAPMTGQQQKPASSGTFTNVRQFVEANRGAGSKIADKATSNIAQNVRQASGQVGQVSALGSDVQQEEQRIGRADQVKQAIQSNPLTLTQDENEFRQARQLIAGQTAAEQQRQMLQERAGAAAQALQGAQQQVQGLGTEAGRFGLLRKAVGGPSYSQGQQRLDQLLFQTEGARQIGQTQRELGSELVRQAQTKEQLEQELTNRIGQYQALAGQKAQELAGELGSEQSKVVESTEQRRQRLIEERARQNQLLEQFFLGTIDNKRLKDVDRDFLQSATGDLLGKRTYGLLKDGGFRDFVQQGNVNLSAKDAIDQESFARYKALADLAALGESERAFTKAGDAGPDSGIKRDFLASEIARREDEIRRALNRQEGKTVSIGFLSGQTRAPYYAGLIPTGNVSGSTNLLDLLASRELPTGGPSPLNFDVSNMGLLHQFGLVSGRGSMLLADQNKRAEVANLMTNAASPEISRYLNDLLNSELSKQNYDEVFGGVTTKNTMGLNTTPIFRK
jgi:hypothetical protein